MALRYATSYETQNDLAVDVRGDVCTMLDTVLADGIDLTLQAKQAHWNVKGPQFISLHELFDQVYASAVEWVDLLAERAVQLGGVAHGTVQRVAERTRLAPYDETLSQGEAHVHALAGAVAQFGTAVRASIAAAEQAGDVATADLFTEIARGADKMLWFLEAHIQN